MKQVKDANGLKAWRAICKDNQKAIATELMAEQRTLMETQPAKDISELPSAIRSWENRCIELHERGSGKYDLTPTHRLNVLVNVLVGNRAETSQLYQELIDASRYSTYELAK